jgi:uncharacterized membrane protein
MDQQPTTPTQEQAPQQPAAPVQEAPVQSLPTPPAGQTPTVPASPVQPTLPPTPLVANNNKKQLMVVTGVVVVALFLLGSMFYIMGVVNRTKRLGAYKSTPTNVPQAAQQVQPTPQSQVSEEEQNAASVNTGDPTADINGLNKDLSTLGN